MNIAADIVGSIARLRVAVFVTGVPWQVGGGSRIAILIKELARHGHEMHVIPVIGKHVASGLMRHRQPDGRMTEY